MKKQNQLLLAGVLAFNFLGTQVFSQEIKLDRPRNINKSDTQMLREAEEGQRFLNGLALEEIKTKYDLLFAMTPVKDQANRGNCVAFASVALAETLYKVKTGRDIDLSEQYAYWASKAIDKIMSRNEGSDPVEFMKSMSKNGVPLEKAWPYEPTGWYEMPSHPDCVKAYKANEEDMPTECITNGNAPSSAIYAEKLVIKDAHRVPSSAEAIMGFLLRGIPVQIAVDVYDLAWGFNNKRSQPYVTGVVKMPAKGDKTDGSHAVLIVGYDKEAQTFLFKNSWGTKIWSAKSPLPGYGLIPFNYVRKYAEASVAKLP